MGDRISTLCTQAKLRAVDLLDASRDGSDAAVCNLACTLLAQYAQALETALGGTVEAPWDSRQGAGRAAPNAALSCSAASGLPNLGGRRRW